MKNPVVIVGMGEMGGVFARGFLRSGHPVYPVVRGMTMAASAEVLSQPALVIIAVAEADLHAVLAQVPDAWRDRLLLLQNELLPNDWQQYELDPTVISVWFEKKKGQDARVLIPSPVYGKHAQRVVDALMSVDIQARVLDSAESLLFELVVKNVYILTTNIAGLKTGGTVAELWEKHREFATQVANEVIQLQHALTGKDFDTSALIDGMVTAFEGDREHKCMGRSAPARLERALQLAEQHGVSLETLKHIASQQSVAV